MASGLPELRLSMALRSATVLLASVLRLSMAALRLSMAAAALRWSLAAGEVMEAWFEVSWRTCAPLVFPS